MRSAGVVSLWRGAGTTSPTGVMRFGWIAHAVNSEPRVGLRYELYRPWRSYDAVVFVKSISPQARRLAAVLRRSGRRVLLDLNVNYFEANGPSYYDGMQPTPGQRDQAAAMLAESDGLICASEYLARAGRLRHGNVHVVTDNVDMSIVPAAAIEPRPSTPLRLLWSGQAIKAFELLAAEGAIRGAGTRVRLVLVTNDLSACAKWEPSLRGRFDRFLADVPHEIIPFRDIPSLLDVYAGGGLVISPRFMDTTYNLGHTEWKLTLAMACARPALCSPIESYTDVRRRACGTGIWIEETADGWTAALDRVLGGYVDWPAEQRAARAVVEREYATQVVAPLHAAAVRSVL